MDNSTLKDGRENFIIKPKSLLFFCKRMVYYININLMYNIRERSINPFSCMCDYYSGCPFPNGAKNYCEYCYLFCKFNLALHENNFSTKNLIKTNIKIVETFTNSNIEITNDDYVNTFLHEKYSFYESVFSKDSIVAKFLM